MCKCLTIFCKWSWWPFWSAALTFPPNCQLALGPSSVFPLCISLYFSTSSALSTVRRAFPWWLGSSCRQCMSAHSTEHRHCYLIARHDWLHFQRSHFQLIIWHASHWEVGEHTLTLAQTYQSSDYVLWNCHLLQRQSFNTGTSTTSIDNAQCQLEKRQN